MKYVLIIISIFSTGITYGSDKCERTEEYKKLKKEAFDLIIGNKSSYKRCINSAHANSYWKAVSMCLSEGKGKNIGGGCEHIVGNGGYPSEKVDTSYCKILRLDFKTYDEFLNHLAELKGVKKCVSK